MPETTFSESRISIEGSTLNPVRTRAAVARVAVALERRLKETCPINKNPNKRGGALRASINVTVGMASIENGIEIQAKALDYMRYVLGGTGAHEILPRSPGGALAFLWSNSAQTIQVGNTGLRRAGRAPISGYASMAANDLRRLVRTSDLRKGGDNAFYKGVHHPGSTANDFVPEALAMIGPELALLEEACGEDVADQVMNGLRGVFGTQTVRM